VAGHEPVWRLPPFSREARQLAARAGLSVAEARFLSNRGITDERTLRSYLFPRLASLIDPMLLRDIDRATGLIIQTIERQEPVTIFGDYDADGLTATALLVRFFGRLHIPVSYYIPNRLTEGYGLNAAAVRRISEKGPGLLITVDCGISNDEEIRLLCDLGMKVVVTDHHQVPHGFEPPCPVVNPHRPDCPFPFKMLSGVGLAFFLAVALRSELRNKGWFAGRPEPDLREYLDLVALGTVADMVPLLDQNRILVSFGLARLPRSLWPGMKALGESLDMDRRTSVGTEDLSFRLAPRLNACGRMGDSATGIRALLTEDPAEARALAARLNELNGRRQSIEKSILNQIEETLPSAADLENRRTLVFAGRGWHRGVLGIVASKIVEKYRRPAVVLDIQDGVATGSARSIPGFDLYRAMNRLKPLLRRFGGHPFAAGLSMDVSRMQEFSREFEAVALEQIRPEDLVPVIEVDAWVHPEDLHPRAVERLNAFAPFGPGNPEPVFYTPGLQVVDARQVGERHVRLRLRKDGAVLDAIGFGFLGRIPPDCGEINCVYTPEITRWQGVKRVELKILDLEKTGGGTRLREEPGEAKSALTGSPGSTG
jgi:single-stranded-DNA-specific exonuclease